MATAKKATKKAATKKVIGKPFPKFEHELQEFFEGELKDIYWAEKKLVTTLPKMEKAATAPSLKKAISNHLTTTKVHVTRLEKIFSLLGKKAQAKKCDAMAGIVEEGEGIIEETRKGSATRDVGIILASQKVEHYEIATYGGLAQLAETLGFKDIKLLLGQTLSEEKKADEELSAIAEKSINFDATKEMK